MRFYGGLFIILLFPELSPPITKKCFQIKLSCVVEDDEKLTHIIEADSFRSRATQVFADRQQRSSNWFESQLKSRASFLDIAPEIDLNELPEVLFEVMPYNKPLTNFTCSGLYWGILALGRFCTDLAALGPYCHDLGPIFPSTALAFS